MLKKFLVPVFSFVFLVGFVVTPTTTFAETSVVPAPAKSLEKLLKKAGAKEIKKLETHDFFEEAYEIVFEQLIDHTNPKAGTFTQRIYFSHKGFDKPVIFETEGYALRHNKPLELAKMLDANQIQVEYRYFGESKPEPYDWQYLTNKQAADDLHHIVELIKAKIYKNNKWVSTGVSKGGETTLIFRKFYPADVDASVPYVAPIILSQADPRTDEWQKTVGEEWCRAKIIAFQRLCLTRSDKLVPMVEKYAQDKGLIFPRGGAHAAFEYAVFEYPFSFWQWGGKCEEIPGLDVDDETLYKHLTSVASPWYYSNEGVDYLEPSFYTHMRELGYYGYPIDHLKDLIKVVHNPTNMDFAPKDVKIEYDSTFIPSLLEWLDANGNNIIYVYGELDTWSACAVTPSKNTNSVKMVAKDASHVARIKHLDDAQKEKVAAMLKEWLAIDKVMLP